MIPKYIGNLEKDESVLDADRATIAELKEIIKKGDILPTDLL